MKKLIPAKETAELLNIKMSTLYAWVHRKKIPFVKLGGKLVFLEDQIVEFINQNSFTLK